MAAEVSQLIIAHETEQVSESPFYIPMTGPATRPRRSLKHGEVPREIPDKEATSVFHLLRQRPLLIFAGGVLLFQLANAAMR